MNSLKICKLHPRIFTPEMPARPAVTEIYGKYLPKMGHDVTWICPSDENNIRKRQYKNLEIITIPRVTSGGLLNKTWDIINYYKTLREKFEGVDRKKRFDIVQVRNSIDYSFLLMNSLKDETPFVFQYSFPKSRYKYEENMLRYVMGFRDSLLIFPILKRSDFVFPISKRMKKDLVQKGIAKSKMMPVPMGVDEKKFSPGIKSDSVIDKYNLKDKIVVGYVGSMSTRRVNALKKLIHGFEKVINNFSESTLLMIGDGSGKGRLMEVTKQLGIGENVIYTGQVPYSKVPHYTSASDIILSLVPDFPIYQESSPTKLVEGMACGKPVVANREIPDHREVIYESEGGKLVDLKPTSIANGIIYLIENPDVREDMGEKGREWIVENRSYGEIAKEIEKVYYDLID